MRIARLLIVLVAALGTRSAAQSNRPALGVFVAPVGYVAQQYTDPPVSPADYVYFVGEPIEFRIHVANGSGTPTLFRASALIPRELFAVSATQDGQPAPLSLAFDDVVIKTTGLGSYSVPLLGDEPLDAEERLGWKVRVTRQLAPGVYRVEFRPRAQDGGGRPIQPFAPSVIFEIRSANGDAQIEVLLRRATSHYFQEQYYEARQALDALLARHPRSYLAHLMKSRLAGREGKLQEARKELQEATDALDADELFARHATPSKRTEARAALRKESSSR